MLYQLLVSGTTLGLFLQVVPFTLFIGGVYAVCHFAFRKKHALPLLWPQELLRFIFVCYLAGLAGLVLTPPNFWGRIWAFLFLGYDSGSRIPLLTFEYNFVPVLVKMLWEQHRLGGWALEMLLGNLVMFVPFGFLLPFVCSGINTKSRWIIAAAVPAFIELVQPFIGRSFDIDDLALNFAGILLGYALAAGFCNMIAAVRRHPKA